MATMVTVDSAKPDFLERVLASGHLIQVDEPQSAGGANAGPTPYDLLVGALGACKAITMRMYAARKGWPLQGVRVELSHEKRHADDCVNCDDAAARLDHIDVRIEIVGSELTASQRQTLLAVAEKCPIQRTLTGRVQIETQAVVVDAPRNE